MSTPLQASHPEINATVSASAGTGKTWLLVTRLIRLLLSGAAPDSLLAITFTRKAAAEMQVRLRERLFELARLDDAALAQALAAIEVQVDGVTLRRARQLYEGLLRSERQPRITTFHAFCQDILRRFPLEADVPAGFELLEQSGALEAEAWEALLTAATAMPTGASAQALDTLLRLCEGQSNTYDALTGFLQHRSDWWAYTYGQADPVHYACAQLQAQLNIDPNENIAARYFIPARTALLAEYADYLQEHDSKKYPKHARVIADILANTPHQESALWDLSKILLDKDGRAAPLTIAKTWAKHLGEHRTARLQDVHQALAAELAAAIEQLCRQHTWQLSRAWYIAGSAWLDHYQRYKLEQRLLDYTDLEWKCYVLLNHADNAHWVQYKLDQRIDHLLIDEFQDTNPTQWQLILPLLEELAAAAAPRPRSVFLVGDAKQSIYRFRRADPQLFSAACAWLNQRLHAQTSSLNLSYRSAPVLMDFVNRIFSSSALPLPAFHAHQAKHHGLWGQVEILPLVSASAAEPHATAATFRQPLRAPRPAALDTRHYDEGRQIAARIQALITEGCIMGKDGVARRPDYSDIMILFRKRTHVHHYEAALRDAHIPYLGSQRGSLLQAQEIQDLISLLSALTLPHDALALATVLRSPLFACSDHDLMGLATYLASGDDEATWFDALLTLGPQQAPGTPLQRAAHLLASWRLLVDHIPVHDLLDKIYCEAQVLARYHAAFPPHLRPRVQANLVRFLELALEVDSGRYPTLLRFLERLASYKTLGEEGPDAAVPSFEQSGVRMMTIHAAKGLEAPIVFLADTTSLQRNDISYHPLVLWPAEQSRPSHYLLSPHQSQQDRLTQDLLAQEQQAQQREEANLLYVALTRAKQLLYISAIAPQGSFAEKLEWYGKIIQALGDAESIKQQGWRETGGVAPPLPQPAPRPPLSAFTPDPRLAQPLHLGAAGGAPTPSAASAAESFMEEEHDGQQRGVIIHRLLELLNKDPRLSAAMAQAWAAQSLGLDPEDPLLAEGWQEAAQVFQQIALQKIFNNPACLTAYNEMPLLYPDQDRLIHGIIDRLMVFEHELWLIDYKTHRHAQSGQLARLAQDYIPQLRMYAEGLHRLWPQKKVRAMLLFTACAEVFEVEV